MKKVVLVLSAVALFVSAPARAQEARTAYIAINPITAILGWYSIEGEHLLGEGGLSVGAAASRFDLGDDDFNDGVTYKSLDAKVRYYPSERGLKGFSLGVSLGYLALTGDLSTEEGEARDRAEAYTTGFVLDYNWILGRSDRLMIGIGGGAKRLWGLDVDESAALPTMRLNVGYAF